MEAGAARIPSAAAWLAAALVVVVVTGVVYLHPSLPAPSVVSTPPAAPDRALTRVSFADANRGAITVSANPLRPGGPLLDYVTSDGGRTWSRARIVVYLQPPIAVRPGAGPGQPAGLSVDGGETWRPLAVPEPFASNTTPTFVDSRHGWWLVTDAGQRQFTTRIWRTDDGGISWRRLAAAGLPTGPAPTMLTWLDPMRGVLSMTGPLEPRPTLFRTDDGGETWRPSLAPASPLPGTEAYLLPVERAGDRLLAFLEALLQQEIDAHGNLTFTNSGSYFDLSLFTLASDDGGRTWGPPIAGPILRTTTLAPPVLDSSGRLLLMEGRRLWVSDDDGATWTARVIQAPSGWTPSALMQPRGRALFATAITGSSPTTDRRFVDGLMRSTDGGAHWEPVRLP